MMKIFSTTQIRQLDEYTILNEPIASIDLTERAAGAFVKWFCEKFTDKTCPVFIFAGPGNNGGDGLAIARLLHLNAYPVQVFFSDFGGKISSDCHENLLRFEAMKNSSLVRLNAQSAWPDLVEGSVLIDALLGSGLNREAQGFVASLIGYLNELNITRTSVDIPSGMFADQISPGISIHAHYTLSFELPKLAFFFSENAERVGEWQVRPIGLSPEFIKRETANWLYTDMQLAASLLRKRRKYDHKGTFGHALLIAGSKGMVGAAVLASRACLRSGVGLLTSHVPASACDILQSSVPEAMASLDSNQLSVSAPPDHLQKYRAVGIGCGIGTSQSAVSCLEKLLELWSGPLVLDADALNILAENRQLISMLPANSILTPHPGEFERLFGSTLNSLERLQLLREKARALGVFIILKTAQSAIAAPDGNCYFNSTGNPGMATAGSGDVLTGILTGLLAQQYPPLHACLLGVYLHGLAGDLAAAECGAEALLSSDIVQFLGKSYLHLQQAQT
jgi:NAD(P)H-hydrate epimerase